MIKGDHSSRNYWRNSAIDLTSLVSHIQDSLQTMVHDVTARIVLLYCTARLITKHAIIVYLSEANNLSEDYEARGAV